MEADHGENDPISELFDKFCCASTCNSIISSFQALCNRVDLKHADHRNFYRKIRARITTWKAQALWAKIDKRAVQKEYRRGEACANTRVIVIGGGIVGLRAAIETALLGARTVLVEKRDRFSRNNVLHLWPFLITDLKNLGAKKFFGKFCAGAIDHISIRQLQCILLKVALLVGVEIHVNVGFVDIIEPVVQGQGWRIKVDPENHPLSEYEFDVLVGADGKRNTLAGFKRKEFRGKLAIAITANFINRNTQAEARVQEISGVAFIFNQKFFKDLNECHGIDLENIVYYKDETHYFVMTAKKASLLDKGVLKRDCSDTAELLARDNVDQDCLANYAREAADFSTNSMLPHQDFAVNHYGQADLAMFDFTSLFQAENASRVIERMGRKLLMILVGDSLLEPFWPTGSGCARGFLGAFDAAWMIKQFSSGKMTTLQIIAERESVYQLLSQTTPENLQKNHNQFTIDPATRYLNLKAKWLKPHRVRHLYDTGNNSLKDDIIEMPTKPANDDIVDTYSLLRWCQKILNTGKYHTINVNDLSMSWKSGLAFCALVHSFKPEAIEYNSLNEADVVSNNQLAFDLAHKEFSINPVMTGEDMANIDKPDKLTIAAYLSQFYDLFKKQRPPSDDYLNTSFEDNRKHRSPSHRLSILQKIRSSRVSLSKLKKSIKKDKDTTEEVSHHHTKHHHHSNHSSSSLIGYNTNNNNNNHSNKIDSVFTRKAPEPRDITNGHVELTRYNKLPLSQISSRLEEGNAGGAGGERIKDMKMREQMMPVVKVSKMAELLLSKFKKNSDQPAPVPVGKRVKGQPMMVASQPASEFCFFCKKRVYIMERMSVENVFFHSQCFKCEHCAANLRANTYVVDKTSYGDAYRFFCNQHAHPTSRFTRPTRKRLAEDKPDVCKPTPTDPSDTGPTPTKMLSASRSDKKTPENLSPVANTDEVLLGSLKTPERIEFENTIEGLPEETEEEQWQHNRSMSLAHDDDFLSAPEPMEEDDDEDSDDSDLEPCDDDTLSCASDSSCWELESEDEEFQEAVDLYNSGRLEESICLAKESLRRSTEDLLHDGYIRMPGDNSQGNSDEDTEVDDSDNDYETDSSDTEIEDEPSKSSITDSKSTSSTAPFKSLPKPLDKPTPLGARSPGVIKSRADFFSTPPEPVRLDAFKMFGMERKSVVPVSQEPSISSGNGEVKVTTSGVGDMESDEATDSQVGSGVLDNKVLNAELNNNTDDEADEAFISAEFDPVIHDEETLEKTAVSRAMEQLLADMDNKSESSSDADEPIFKDSSEDDVDDDVFHAYRRQLSSKSSVGSKPGSDYGTGKTRQSRNSSDVDYRKKKSSSRSSGPKHARSSSELEQSDKGSLSGSKKYSQSANNFGGDTEKSVLRSVQQMSENSSSSLGSGETTLEVLRSVNNIKEGGQDKCIEYLDDKFVTQTRGSHGRHSSRGSGRQSDSAHKSSSSESFTLSTPTHSSRHTSSSSLSEEFEINKKFLDNVDKESDDDRPDSQMLRDYQLTMSHALGEDSDEISPREDSPILEEDLDQTLNAEMEDMVQTVTRKSDIAESDKSGMSEYLSPQSERTSSVYGTPETSPVSVDPPVVSPTKNNESKGGLFRKLSSSLTRSSDPSKSVQKSATKKKKLSTSGKPAKVIKQASLDSEEAMEMVPHSTKTIIRPYKHSSREGSVEKVLNQLEKDAWGSSESCSSVSSTVETAQKPWRPLPPVPQESHQSPIHSKSSRQAVRRKLPVPSELQSKSPVEFQSNFMKKAYVSTSDSASDSNKADESVVEKGETLETDIKLADSVITSQPRPLPVPIVGAVGARPPINNIGRVSVGQTSDKSGDKGQKKTKISVDYSNIKSNFDKDSGSENESKKKRIPVANALKKSVLKPSLSGTSSNSVEENMDEDIPFADDSEDDVLEDKFFTPATSKKHKPRVHREDGGRDAKKRILPLTPPKAESKSVLSPDHIRDIRKAEIEKAREEARERARLKSDEELGIRDMGYTPGHKNKVSVSRENSHESSSQSRTSSVDRLSDSDTLKTPLQKATVSFTYDIPESSGKTPKYTKNKKKKSKDRDSSLSYSSETLDTEAKKEKKKRSLISVIFKTPDKSKGHKDLDRSSSNDTLEEKPMKKKKLKTPKSEKKKDKKKKKSQSVGSEIGLSDNMKDLKIGSMFGDVKVHRPLGGRIGVPPKASVDDFTDSEDELSTMMTSTTSLSDTHSRRFKSDAGPMSEDELNARITRKIQYAARKQQKQQEQKRLRQAQEIQRKLQEVDVKQRELEERGVVVEKALRKEGPEAGRPEADLMQDWFNLVHEKNALVRMESEFMVSARELELEDRQGRLQSQLRESMTLDVTELDDDVFEEPSGVATYWKAIYRNDILKSPLQQEREQKIYSELIEVVEERDKLVAMLEEERVREQEEDRDLENVMRAKGFSLSPTSGSKILRKNKPIKTS